MANGLRAPARLQPAGCGLAWIRGRRELAALSSAGLLVAGGRTQAEMNNGTGGTELVAVHAVCGHARSSLIGIYRYWRLELPGEETRHHRRIASHNETRFLSRVVVKLDFFHECA